MPIDPVDFSGERFVGMKLNAININQRHLFKTTESNIILSIVITSQTFCRSKYVHGKHGTLIEYLLANLVMK